MAFNNFILVKHCHNLWHVLMFFVILIFLLFQPPYALIGSLNGLHVFGEAQGVYLHNTRTSNATITWKTYHDW